MLTLVAALLLFQDDPEVIPIPDPNAPQEEQPDDTPPIPIPGDPQERPPVPVPIDPAQQPPAPKFETKVQVQAEGKIENVEGNQTQSSLNEDPHIIVDERSTTIWRLEGNRSLEILTAARATDDPRVDPDKYNLTTFTVTYKTPLYTVVGGDFGVNFSQYTVSGSFRGGYSEVLWGSVKMKAFLGTNKPQWRMLFEDKDREPPDRFFQGIRFETADSKSPLILGAGFAHARDYLSSIDDSSGFIALESWVLGTDARWMVTEILMVKAEIAVTDFDPNINDDITSEDGVAARLESEIRLTGFRWNTQLEHISRDFAAASAGAGIDRDMAKTNLSWDMIRILNITGGLSRIRQPMGTVTTWIDEVDARFRLHRVPDWEDWTFVGAYRIRMTQTNDHGGEGNSHQADASLNRSVAGFTGGIDGSLRVQDNFDNPGHSEARVCGITLGVPCEFIYAGSTFGIRYSHEDVFERPSINNSESHMGTATLSIRLPFPLTASMIYSLQSVDRRAADADTIVHTGRFEVIYTFEGPNRAWISFSLEIRDNAFEAAGRDYQEQIYSLRGFFEY